MNEEELKLVIGGGTNYLSGTFINAISKLISTILDLGRSIGSALNYTINKKSCN